MTPRRKPKKLNAEELWDYALKSLGRRAQSSAELRRKLASRAENSAAITAVMAKLREYGMADDRQFSEAFAAARLDHQGLGKLRVIRDLRTKQIPENVARSAAEKAYKDTNEADLIDAFLRRKYRGKNLPEHFKDRKNLASAYRRLRVAGFSSGAALAGLKRYVDMPEEISEPEEPTD